MGWNHLSIHKLQRCNHWSLGMDKLFHPAFYNWCNYISMLGSKLIHVSKGGHWCRKYTSLPRPCLLREMACHLFGARWTDAGSVKFESTFKHFFLNVWDWEHPMPWASRFVLCQFNAISSARNLFYSEHGCIIAVLFAKSQNVWETETGVLDGTKFREIWI